VHCFNLDGRDFVRSLMTGNNQLPQIDHIIMNLPASAIEFLDVFRGLHLPDCDKRPTIHCYGFSKAVDAAQDAVERAELILGTKLENPTVVNVRLVSPKKWMLRLSFPLPIQHIDDNTPVAEPALKKRKIES